MRELKKKLSIRNVSNLLSDKQMKATIGGSGDPGNLGNSCWIDDRDGSCMGGGEVCWLDDPLLIDIIYGVCHTKNYWNWEQRVWEYTCECIPW